MQVRFKLVKFYSIPMSKKREIYSLAFSLHENDESIVFHPAGVFGYKKMPASSKFITHLEVMAAID